jgi:hypothetical protein
MHDERRNRDYSKGLVWDERSNRRRVEIRYPDGSRVRKRLRREREALRLWATAHSQIENGTWDDRAARNVTVAEALRQYREYSKVQHRSHNSYIGPSLTQWETHLGPQTHLAKVSSQQVEDFKLKRAQKVSHSTTDKDLAILKAFFNWCIAHRLAASNPVRRVKLFHDDNSRLRYLTREEYDRLIEAVRTLKARANRPSPWDMVRPRSHRRQPYRLHSDWSTRLLQLRGDALQTLDPNRTSGTSRNERRPFRWRIPSRPRATRDGGTPYDRPDRGCASPVDPVRCS